MDLNSAERHQLIERLRQVAQKEPEYSQQKLELCLFLQSV